MALPDATTALPVTDARTVAVLTLLALILAPAALPASPPAPPPVAASVPATDAYPGFTVTDPYRNLEDLADPATQVWMKAQAEHARRTLDAIPERTALRAEIDRLDGTRSHQISRVHRGGHRLFYLRREANAPVARLYVRDRGGEPRMLFDPSSFDSGEQRHAISWTVPSPGGRRVAVGIAPDGSEMAEFHVLDVDSGQRLEGPIAGTWLGIVHWIDEDAMLLGRMREIPPGTPPAEAWLDAQVHLHRVGTPIAEDVHVFGTGLALPPQGLPSQDFTGVMTHAGEPWAVGFGAGARAHYSAWVLAASDLGRPDARWRALFGDDARNQAGGGLRDGQLYAISTQSPNGEIVRYDLASGERHVVRAAGGRAIEALGVARDGLYFRERDGVYTSLKRVGFDGSGEIAVRFPRKGNPSPAADAYTDPRIDGAVVFLDSWTGPDQLYAVDSTGTAMALGIDAPMQGVDLSGMRARDLVATSHDGTPVPLSLVHHGELRPAARQPVILTGYGSYGMSWEPMFQSSLFVGQQRGVAMAVCHVRGGGEFGSAWHEGGRLGTKANTWKDFVACAEALVAQGITVPQQLVGMGTSAGGITITNAVADRPDLFAGAINDVGVSDVLRSLSASRNGPNHYAENGDVRTAEGAAVARAMSGYERIAPGPDWPAWLVIHGVNDPRVEVWQSNKFAARMQAASPRPVIYRLDYATGHGMGSTADARKDWAADILAFALDVTRADPSGPPLPDTQGTEAEAGR